MIRVLDLETQNHPYFGLMASVQNPENYVVELGWRDFEDDGTPITEVLSKRFESVEEANSSDVFDLTGVDKLVVHNAQYELSWYLKRYPNFFIPFFQRGGRVLCTAMAEYLLSHQTELYPSLNETAVKHGGTHKVDGVKILWENGTLTSDIDPDLLHEYLTGPNGDIDNTAKCFFSQRDKLIQQKMWQVYLVRCDALVAYAMCEVAGLYVNNEVAMRNLEAHKKELQEIQEEIKKLLPTDLPPEFEFNWGSLYHKSALIFGGGVVYKKKISYNPIKYEKADFYQTLSGDLVPITSLPADPVVTYKSGVNKGLPKVIRADTKVEKLRWGSDIYRFKPLINIHNLPEVLRSKFSNDGQYKGEWVTSLTLGDGVSPVYTTGTETLKALSAHGLKDAQALLRQATLIKDITTYYISEELDSEGNVKTRKGALQFVTDKGIIHHNLNATATVTGRLSSSRPNLQNIPRGDKDESGKVKSRVKEMFTSRFGENGRIVQVDYSALEVVVLAALSKDVNLLKALAEGRDMHCMRLAYKLKESYVEVYKKCHDSTHPEHVRYKQLRTEIKPVVFAAQYGATVDGLVYATGVTPEFAKEFLEAEAGLFPESIDFRRVVLDEVNRTSENNIEREFIDGSWRVYKRGYWQAPGGTCYSFRQVPVWNKEIRSRVMDFKATQIANYWNQGEAAFVMTTSMARIARWLIKNDFFKAISFPEGRVFLINNVHDAVYLDVHKDLAVEVARTVKKIMEDVARYLSKYLGYDIAHVAFPAEAEVGIDMTHGEVIN